jgi:hypothetical protein
MSETWVHFVHTFADMASRCRIDARCLLPDFSFMRLVLRKTWPESDTHFTVRHEIDAITYPVGSILLHREANPANWSWTINIITTTRLPKPTGGREDTREEAMRAFKARWFAVLPMIPREDFVAAQARETATARADAAWRASFAGWRK